MPNICKNFTANIKLFINMNIELFQPLLVAIFISAAASLLGCFAILKRMALVGDALSHVALPGIALGLMFNFNPFLGALAFLILGTLLIWLIEHKTKLPVDTLVGVFFAVALAIGALLTPETEILEALFGDISNINFTDFLAVAIVSALIIGLILFLSRRLMLTM